MQAFKLMKEESGKQAQLNAQMTKILKKQDKEHAQLRDELAAAQAKAVQLAVENERLKQQVPCSNLSFSARLSTCIRHKVCLNWCGPC